MQETVTHQVFWDYFARVVILFVQDCVVWRCSLAMDRSCADVRAGVLRRSVGRKRSNDGHNVVNFITTAAAAVNLVNNTVLYADCNCNCYNSSPYRILVAK